MKGFTTKYALTKGIQTVEVEGPPEAGYTGKYRYWKDRDGLPVRVRKKGRHGMTDEVYTSDLPV